MIINPNPTLELNETTKDCLKSNAVVECVCTSEHTANPSIGLIGSSYNWIDNHDNAFVMSDINAGRINELIALLTNFLTCRETQTRRVSRVILGQDKGIDRNSAIQLSVWKESVVTFYNAD